MFKPYEIHQDGVITNGEPDADTIKRYTDKGYVFLATMPAKDFHPKAMPTDRITFFAKPIDEEAYDAYYNERNLCVESNNANPGRPTVQ